MKLEKLTETEKKFAEENHNLVYGFLHKNGYSIESFYNIVVFGYLKGGSNLPQTERFTKQV